MSFGGPADIIKFVNELRVRDQKKPYSKKKVVPILRGWIEGINNPNSMNLITDLRSDIEATKYLGTTGYAVFTYESFLWELDRGQRTLNQLMDNLEQ